MEGVVVNVNNWLNGILASAGPDTTNELAETLMLAS